jgi:hypothetical protein
MIRLSGMQILEVLFDLVELVDAIISENIGKNLD